MISKSILLIRNILEIRPALSFRGHVLVGDGTPTNGEKWLGFNLAPAWV
jgi:hypothetical protein